MLSQSLFHFHKLLITKARHGLFECNSHCDSKYSHEIPKLFAFLNKIVQHFGSFVCSHRLHGSVNLDRTVFCKDYNITRTHLTVS